MKIDKEVEKEVEKVTIPDKMPKEEGKGLFSLSFEELMKREEYVNQGMYGFVSWKWILPFVEWLGERKCLEVMAGRGWWSYALEQKGVSVHATDNFSWHEQGRFNILNDTLVNMEKLDAVEAVRKYGKDVDVVLMSWPYMDNTAYKVIKALYKVNPKAIVVYIGERMGGCTASDAFFANFEEIYDASFVNVQRNYETWAALHDDIYIGRYQSEDSAVE